MKHARIFFSFSFTVLGFAACSGYEGGGDVLVAGGVLHADSGAPSRVDSGTPRGDAGTTDARSDATPPTPSTVIAYWPLDGDGTDESPRNGDLSLDVTNGTFTTGQVADALAMLVPGVAADRTRSDPALAFGANDFTVQAWVRTTYPSVSLGTRELNVAASDGWMISVNPTSVRFTTNDPRGPLAASVAGGVFHHVVVRRAAGHVDLFVDTSKRATRDAWPEIGQERVFNIGQNPATNSPGSPSLVDEVVIWSRAISDDEIQRNYARGKSGQPAILEQ